MKDITFGQEQETRIAEWLRKVKFRKQIIGGVSEADVFRKIRELNDMYREALIAERARYDALLAEHAAAQTKSGKRKEGENA